MRLEVYNAGTLKGYMVGGVSGLPVSGAHFGVMALSSSTPPTISKSQDKIIAGSRGGYGKDRACRHYALEGDGIILSSSTVTTEIKDVATYTGYTPSSTRLLVNTFFRDTGVKYYDIVGPVITSLPVSWYRKFPDMENNTSVVSECYLSVSTTSLTTIRITRHYVSRNKTTGKTNTVHVETNHEIDFVKSRTRVVGSSSWKSFVALKTTAFEADLSSLPVTWRDYEKLLKRVRLYYKPRPIDSIYGDLVRRCANDAQVVQTNSIELVRDIRELADTLKNAYSLVKGKWGAKKIASAYLQYKYGLRLTAQDLNLVARTFRYELTKQYSAYSKVHASEQYYDEALVPKTIGLDTSKFTYTIRYRPYENDWRRTIQLAQDSGLFPSLQNSWDLIPLSFVVDWFTDLSERLSMFDAATYWSSYDILGSVWSEKHTYRDAMWAITGPSWVLTGSCDFRTYVRNHSSYVHKPTYYEDTPREFKNYAEALALIVANKKR